MEKLKLYIKESYYELLNKVTWPTWESLFATTRVVIIATLIFTILVFIMSLLSNKLMDIVYSI